MKINNINLIIKNHFTNSLQNNFDNKKSYIIHTYIVIYIIINSANFIIFAFIIITIKLYILSYFKVSRV